MTRRPPRGVVTAVCVLILAAAAVQVPLPVFVERPLEPLALNEALTVDGTSAAELDSTYHVGLIGRRRATTVRALAALLRGDHRLRSERVVVPRPVDDATLFAQRRRLFAASVQQAGAAALTFLGRPVPQRTGGVAVVDVVVDSPADGALEATDVILSVDGKPMTAPGDLRAAVDGRSDAVALVVERAGEERRVELAPAAFEAGGRERVGLGVVTSLAEPRAVPPLDVDVDGGRTTGPSAGLMVALAVLDVLETDRDLAAGRRVAGTGRITADGHVRSVSAVPTKVAGAVRDGAEVFVVPESQRTQAERAAAGRLEVIGARTLTEAVTRLDAHAGRAQTADW